MAENRRAQDLLIGYIGQGWVGRHCADRLQADGYRVVRYALEEPYRQNRPLIAGCDVVFIAVPTPASGDGLDPSAVIDALACVGAGRIAVVKSTLLPGTTEMLQQEFPDLTVLHSPEFLTQANAAWNVAHPDRNIVGIPVDTPENRKKATLVLSLLPDAPYQKIMGARDAELTKVAGNCFLFAKVLYFNLIFDVAQASGCDWATVEEAVTSDPRIGPSHAQPIHDGGRGVGGNCLPKDFEAFRRAYLALTGNTSGAAVLETLEAYNAQFLKGVDG